MPTRSARCSCSSLHHQALQHLTAQHVRPAAAEVVLLLQAAGDHPGDLLVQFALHDDAVIGDGHDAVEQHAGMGSGGRGRSAGAASAGAACRAWARRGVDSGPGKPLPTALGGSGGKSRGQDQGDGQGQ